MQNPFLRVAGARIFINSTNIALCHESCHTIGSRRKSFRRYYDDMRRKNEPLVIFKSAEALVPSGFSAQRMQKRIFSKARWMAASLISLEYRGVYPRACFATGGNKDRTAQAVDSIKDQIDEIDSNRGEIPRSNGLHETNAVDDDKNTRKDMPPFRGSISKSPYIRLIRMDKPIGTYLLFLPCAMSISLAAPLNNFPDFMLFGLFAVGSLLLRSAGCIVNDIWDRDIDKKVERTKNTRPLATGELSVAQAVGVLGGCLGLGLIILMQLNYTTIGYGLGSLPLFFLYPGAKRFLQAPQMVLGLNINWGALMGWTAVTSKMAVPAVLLYGSCWCWTMVYDTIYAHQDKKDDWKLNMGNSAILFGNKSRLWLSALTLSQFALFSASGYMVDLGVSFYVGSMLSCTYALNIIRQIEFDNPKQCMQGFVDNKNVGAGMVVSIILGKWF